MKEVSGTRFVRDSISRDGMWLPNARWEQDKRHELESMLQAVLFDAASRWPQPVCLLGDFNVQPVESDYLQKRLRSGQLLDACLWGDAVHKAKMTSRIDLILVNGPSASLMCTCEVWPGPNVKDHSEVVVTLNICLGSQIRYVVRSVGTLCAQAEELLVTIPQSEGTQAQRDSGTGRGHKALQPQCVDRGIPAIKLISSIKSTDTSFQMLHWNQRQSSAAASQEGAPSSIASRCCHCSAFKHASTLRMLSHARRC